MNEQFNQDKLDLARRRRGMSQSALAEATSISKRSLIRYMKGEREPGQDAVLQFATVLDFPPKFFYGPTLDEVSQDGPSFRAMSTLTVRQRNQAVAAGTLGMALSDWIDTHFGLPEPDIPRYATAEPEAAAMAVRNSWGLGERAIGNMMHLLELHGSRVFSLAEDTRAVDAYSFWRNETPFIFLNTTKSAERSRMDVAHELGHLVLHSKGGAQRSRSAERDAQLFGSALLMPRGSVLAKVRPGLTVPQIIKAKRYWKVSAANLTYRMRQLCLMTEHHYTRSFIELTRRGYRSEEPDGLPRETSQVLEKIFGRLRERGITVAHVADDLSVTPQELSKFLFGLVRFPLIV